jgi:outer membrane protein TolC
MTRLLILLFLAWPLPAQAPDLSVHPKVRAALFDLEQTTALRLRAIGSWAPTIELRGNFGPQYIQDTVNGRPDPAIKDWHPGAWTVEVALVQPILKDTLLTDDLASLDLAIAVRQAQLDEACAAISRDDAAILSSILSSSDRGTVAKSTRALLLQVMSEVKARVAAKDVPATDLLEVQDRAARWELIGLDAHDREEQAKARYEQLWSEAPAGPKTQAAAALQLAGAFESCRSAQDCSELANLQHPAVLVKKAEAAAAQLTADQRDRLRLPQVDLEAGASRSTQYNTTFEEDQLYARVRARVPLPWGLEAQGDLAAKRAAASAAQSRFTAVARDAGGQAVMAHVVIASSASQARALAKRKTIAEATLSAMREAYRAGKKDARSYLDAAETVANIELERLRLAEDANTARAALAFSTGALRCPANLVR